MTNALSPGARFRAALADPSGPLLIPGVFNALVARMAERLGFQAVYQSGAVLSAGVVGVPDVGLVSQTEFAQQAQYLTQAVSIPVISDADTGFGEPLAVERTMRLFETAGLAGLHLEDQQLPKRCGHLTGKTLVTEAEMVAKIQAATQARADDDFVIIARTDARSVEGFDAAINRVGAYIEAGADVIFPEALQSPEEFGRFAEAISVPLLANMTEFGQSPLLNAKQLGELGYAAVLFPVTTLRIAMKAVEEALTGILSEGTQEGLLDRMQTRAELYDLLDYADFNERDRTWFQADGSSEE